MITNPVHSRRGTVTVALLMAFVLLQLVVAGVVIAGSRDHQMIGLRVQGDRAEYAALSAANMAVKEIMDGADLDGDGVVGGISNDSNTSTDPALGATRMWAASAASGSTTTITARGQNADAARAVQVQLVSSASSASVAGTILLVVVNSSSLDAQEAAKKSLIESWGYTVVPISDTATQAAFDAACRTSSLAYISETVLSGNVGTKLTNTTIPVITEESSLSDELGIAGSMTTMTDRNVNIINTTHYITSTLTAGTVALFTSDQPLRYLSGTFGGFTTLGRRVATTDPTFVVMERGATLTPSGAAAGRRVYLPWGNTGVNINALTDDGRTIMRRSIEWCLMPVAHWKLDDGSGATATESIAGHNGTLSGPTWTTGRVDGGLTLNGTSDYVSIPNNAAFQVTTSLTVAGWIRGVSWPSNADLASVILRKGEANPNNWELHVCQGRVKLALDDYDAYGFSGSTVLTTGQWNHVAATWDGATVRIYLNGVLDNTPTSRAAPIGTDSRDVYLGGRSGVTDVTNGSVDDVRFYSRALTAAEIAVLASPSSRPKITSWQAVAP